MIEIEQATPETVRYIIERPRDIEIEAYRVMGITDPLMLIDSFVSADHAFITRHDGEPTVYLSLMLDGPVAKYNAIGTPGMMRSGLYYVRLARDFHRWGAERYPDLVHVSCAHVDSPAIRFMQVVGLEPTHVVDLNGLPIQVLGFDARKYSHQPRIVDWESRQQ